MILQHGILRRDFMKKKREEEKNRMIRRERGVVTKQKSEG